MCVVYRGGFGVQEKQGEHGGVELYYIEDKKKKKRTESTGESEKPCDLWVGPQAKEKVKPQRLQQGKQKYQNTEQEIVGRHPKFQA